MGLLYLYIFKLLGSPPFLRSLYIGGKNGSSLGMLPCTAQTEHTLPNNDIHRHTCGATTYRLSPITYQVVKTLLKIFIQENAVDLHS